jgi:tetratricopeptide (TPR) repeat protein
LAQKEPEAYLPQVAMTLNNLGILDRDRNRITAARKEYEEALEIYEAFAKQDPEQFSPDVERVRKLLQELPK